MKQALGLVEIAGLCIAVAAADAMVKAANVELVELEPAKGGGYMTIKVVGNVGAVNAAVMAGCQIGKEHQKLVAWKVIPRPSDFVEDTFVIHKAEEPKKPDPDPTPEPPVKTQKEAPETVKEEAEPEGKPEETQAEPEVSKEAEGIQPENKDSAEDKVAEDKRAEDEPAQEEKEVSEAPNESENPQTTATPKRPSRKTSRKK